MAAAYPAAAPAALQADARAFLAAFARLYPCWVCADDFQAYLRRHEARVAGRADLGRWLCDAHNHVNRRLGKPSFDCRLWEERWRSGCGGDALD
jgi:FAD-linked sulfhydryl oxidase